MNKFKLTILRGTTLVVSIGFIVGGVIRKEHLVVLKKSINICLECIGIG